MTARIEQVLRRIGAPGRFAVQRSLPAAALSLSVKGIGTIDLPVSAETAQDLCAIATKAPFGRRNRTILDTAVRDTWEIDSKRIRIAPRSEGVFAKHLTEIGEDLGVPKSARLRPELDKMLVYEPGQFFVQHQDSEKTDGMIGTLLVILPSAYTGGTLIIAHGGETERVEAPRKSSELITLVAFYADCRHEVRPLKSGHRVVLSYNLVAEGDTLAPMGPGASPPGVLEAELERFFVTPRASRYHRAPEMPPDRLVYLLDHEYTLRGLSWKRLKNGDAQRGLALLAAAEALDCGVGLALADVHEIWSCADEEFEYGRSWNRLSRADVDPEQHQLNDLEDSEIALTHVIDANDCRIHGHDGGVAGDELCETKASVDMKPYRSEHEGYMGNYGNTVDRWYHRAAIVLWPRSRDFIIRAKASSAWAVQEISRDLQGRLEEARARVRSVLPFFNALSGDAAFFARTLTVAAALDNAELASELVAGFGLDRVTPSSSTRIVKLLDRYGLPWCEIMFSRWEERGRYSDAHRIPDLPGVLKVFFDAGSDDALGLSGWLVERQWRALRAACETILAFRSPRDLDEALQAKYDARRTTAHSRSGCEHEPDQEFVP